MFLLKYNSYHHSSDQNLLMAFLQGTKDPKDLLSPISLTSSPMKFSLTNPQAVSWILAPYCLRAFALAGLSAWNSYLLGGFLLSVFKSLALLKTLLTTLKIALLVPFHSFLSLLSTYHYSACFLFFCLPCLCHNMLGFEIFFSFVHEWIMAIVPSLVSVQHSINTCWVYEHWTESNWDPNY
jgi:hypothetical protein